MKMTLKKLRKNKDLTIKEASQTIGVTERTLWSWENNKTVPKINFIPIIEELYDCKYDEIFFLDQNYAESVNSHKNKRNINE